MFAFLYNSGRNEPKGRIFLPVRSRANITFARLINIALWVPLVTNRLSLLLCSSLNHIALLSISTPPFLLAVYRIIKQMSIFRENAVLLYCYKELDKRFSVVNAKKVTKQQRVEATVLNSLLPISKQEVCYVLPDISPTTVEYALAGLVKSGLIEKVGTGRNTKYIKKQ